MLEAWKFQNKLEKKKKKKEDCICPLGNSQKPYLATVSCENNIYQHQNQAPEEIWFGLSDAQKLKHGSLLEKIKTGKPLARLIKNKKGSNK